MTKTVNRNCPVCGNGNENGKTLVYSPPEWPMKECSSCGMVYLIKSPDPAELFENLAWEKSSKAENTRREREHGLTRKISKATRWRLHIFPRKNIEVITQKYAKPGRILDLGCGDGSQLSRLADGYAPYGIEVSKNLALQAEKILAAKKGKVANADALTGLRNLPDTHFTGIMMRSFLEHDIDPKNTLLEAHRVLVAGGIVVIKVPNYGCINRTYRGKKWCGFRFPDHVNYFTPKTLRNLVTECGFDIVRDNFLDRLPISDNMWLVACKT
jgi:SAM-dependent methyltransferase